MRLCGDDNAKLLLTEQAARSPDDSVATLGDSHLRKVHFHS
jgi:hypothetical protein